jgi:phage shock protein A
MSLWKRFVRAIRSMFGGAISGMEDPRLILKQNIRELNDQVPKMNENIATVKSNMIMLEKDVKRNEQEVQQLTSKIKAAIQSDRDDVAEKYALRLEKARENLEKTRGQLEQAAEAYEKAVQVKKSFMREREEKIDQAKDALRAHERAQWQAEVADVMEQFEVTGIDQTHDEMIQRIREDTARSEARMEIALDSVDSDMVDIEEEAEEIRAAEIVKQFKTEMGREDTGQRQIEGKQPTESTTDQIPESEKQSREEHDKTLGRDRSRTE